VVFAVVSSCCSSPRVCGVIEGLWGGGFALLGLSVIAKALVPASQAGATFLVRHVRGVHSGRGYLRRRNWTVTGGAESAGHYGRQATVVFASKIPDQPGTRTFKRYLRRQFARVARHFRARRWTLHEDPGSRTVERRRLQMEPIRQTRRQPRFYPRTGRWGVLFRQPERRDRSAKAFRARVCLSRRTPVVFATARIRMGQ